MEVESTSDAAGAGKFTVKLEIFIRGILVGLKF